MSVIRMDWWDVLKAPIYYREEAQPFPRAQRERVVSQTAGEQPQEHFGQPPRNPNTNLRDSFDPNKDGYGFTELNLPGAFPPFRNRDPTGPTNTRDAFFEAQDESSRGVLRLVSDNPPVYELPMYGVLDAARGQGMGREGIEEMRRDLEQRHGEPVQIIPQGMTTEALPFWDKMLEERVVDNPNRVKKEAKSPKALRHKREYETRYESSPERKRYRRDLERERRKRGVAGKGGKDMSHTKRGTIVPEDPHSNRARSHPSVGSTLKSERDGYDTSLPDDHPAFTTPVEFDERGEPVPRRASDKGQQQVDIGGDCPLCEQGRKVHTYEGAVGCTVPDCYANTSSALMNSYGRAIHRPIPPERLDETGDPVEHSSTVRDGMRVVGNVNDPNDPRVMPEGTRIVYGGDMPDQYHFDMPRPTPIYFHGRNTPSYDMSGYFSTGNPMDLSFRMLKEQTRLFQQGQQTLDGKPAFAPTDFAAMEQRRKEAEAEAKSKEARRQKMMEQARKAGMTTPLHAFAAQTPAPEDSQRPE